MTRICFESHRGWEYDGQGHEMVPEEGEQVMGSRRF